MIPGQVLDGGHVLLTDRVRQLGRSYFFLAAVQVEAVAATPGANPHATPETKAVRVFDIRTWVEAADRVKRVSVERREFESLSGDEAVSLAYAARDAWLVKLSGF